MKGEIKGTGKIQMSKLPNIEEVFLVKGLTSNLINISQLCDQGFNVNFTKDECIITNKDGEVTMKGRRNNDNCYLWVPLETNLKDKQFVGKNSLKNNTSLKSADHNVPMNVSTSVKSAKVNDQSTKKRTMNLVQ